MVLNHRCPDTMWTETHCSVTTRRLRRSCRGWWLSMWRHTTRWDVWFVREYSRFIYREQSIYTVLCHVCVYSLPPLFCLGPEFPQRPANVVRRSGSSPLLPPATCSSHTELTTWGSCCGAGRMALLMAVMHLKEKGWGWDIFFPKGDYSPRGGIYK